MIYWQITMLIILGIGTSAHWFEVATRQPKTTQDSISMLVTTSLFVWGLILMVK